MTFFNGFIILIIFNFGGFFIFSYKNEQHRKLVSKGRRERERERWLLSKEQKMKAKLSMKAKIKQHVKVAR